MREGGAALCIAETEKLSNPLIQTAPYVYLRLRKEAYDSAMLEAWAEKIRTIAASAQDIYIYFKHEAAAPELAAALTRLLT